MTTIADILKASEKVINEILRKEIKAQGHINTGAMSDSLTSNVYTKGKQDIMDGLAVDYMKIVNDGYPGSSANNSQAPFLIAYFVSKGYPEVSSDPEQITAVQLAFATIKKWQKEGMPTAASNRFSSVTRRKRMIENAFDDGKQKIDEFILNGIDFVVEERFQQEKSETI